MNPSELFKDAMPRAAGQHAKHPPNSFRIWRLAFLIILIQHGQPIWADRLDLNGDWTFSIHGQYVKTVQVPSTYLPVGGATLERRFQCDGLGEAKRALLRFDGIVTTARVRMNGAELGEFGPYTPFTIDVTEQLRAGRNLLSVDIDDLDGMPPWGRTWITAFPRFGGISRNVYLEWKASTYIDNARLDYRLVNNYSRAECRLTVWIKNTGNRMAGVAVSGSLAGNGQKQSFQQQVQASPGISQHVLQFALSDVHLWSPEVPSLYSLDLEMKYGNRQLDRFSDLTGFKEFTARGRDFFLNGKKIFLRGIFRHDIQGYQGHTATREQMERDIADIKSLGCNFLRLGHYPQNRYVTELAAKYGLLTSGEPPVFGMNQQDHKVVEGAKYCLSGMIRRDWNNPAAAIWIISNEVGTDLEYMKEMAAFVRKLDASRLISIVDNTKWTAENAPWEKYRKAGIDFICQNAYGSGVDGYYEKIEKILPADLPYVISEWGGPAGYNQVLREGARYLEKSTLRLQEGPRIAGVWFWEYQDIPMARWTSEGLLHWSIVDIFRRPYEQYYALKSLYTGTPALPPRGRAAVPPMEETLPSRLGPLDHFQAYDPIDLSSLVNSDDIIAGIKPLSRFAYPEQIPMGRVAVDGLPFLLSPQVVMLSTKSPIVRIPIGKPATEVEFLGHVCFNSPAMPAPAAPKELPWIMEAGMEGATRSSSRSDRIERFLG